MRRVLALAAVCLALPAAAEVRTWNFRVLLDDREIGEHQYTLRATGGQHELLSQAHFDVRLLFLNAYRYRHEALERWDGNCLQSLSARTETNGERQAVSAAARDGRLVCLDDLTPASAKTKPVPKPRASWAACRAMARSASCSACFRFSSSRFAAASMPLSEASCEMAASGVPPMMKKASSWPAER